MTRAARDPSLLGKLNELEDAIEGHHADFAQIKAIIRRTVDGTLSSDEALRQIDQIVRPPILGGE